MSTWVHVAWAGEHRFDSGQPGGPTLRIDASGKTGQSPVDAVLSALATCVSADIVDILAKRRTPMRSLTVDMSAERVETIPRYLKRVMMNFTIAGENLERAQVERAIDLSITKYCSVRDTLRPDLVIEWTLLLQP